MVISFVLKYCLKTNGLTIISQLTKLMLYTMTPRKSKEWFQTTKMSRKISTFLTGSTMSLKNK